MKNKAIRLIFASCIALTFTTQLQAENIETNYRVTPFYIQPIFSGTYSNNENTHFQDWYKVLGYGASLSFGKEFSPLWGWRATAAFNRNHQTANWRNMQRDYDRVWFNSAEIFGDITFDFTDLVFQSPKFRHWKVMLFAGLGGAKSFNFDKAPLMEPEFGTYTTNPKPVWGCRAGINLSYLFSKRAALTVEASGTWFQDRFNGVNWNRDADERTALGAGLTLFLGKWKTTTLPEIVTPIVQPQEVQPEKPITLFLAYIAPEPETKQRRTIGAKANLEFPVDQTILYPNFRKNNQELNKIWKSIDQVKNDEDFEIKNISLHGYASPEGKYAHNVDLSKGRVEALRDAIMKKYNMNAEQFTLESTPEDWEGFKNYVDTCRLADKAYIKQLIANNKLSPDAKEAEMRKKIPTTFKYIVRNVFPTLRHTEYAIDYNIRTFTIEETKQRAIEHPDRLTLDELYQAANTYNKKSDEAHKLYQIAAKQNPNSSVANLNAANSELENKNIEAAQQYLQHVQPSNQKTHAEAVIELLKGNKEKARQMFQTTAEAGLQESLQMLKQLQ